MGDAQMQLMLYADCALFGKGSIFSDCRLVTPQRGCLGQKREDIVICTGTRGCVRARSQRRFEMLR
jgi:hypothetical protein